MLPGLLKFDGDCLIVLRETLLAVRPEEGCALLIGERFLAHSPIKKIFLVKQVWPCCNIWQAKKMNFPKQSKITEKGGKTFISRQNRFFLC